MRASVDDVVILDCEGGAGKELLVGLGNGSAEHDRADLGQGDGVVEVLVVDEPLVSEVSAAILNKRLVHWNNVLHSALV